VPAKILDAQLQMTVAEQGAQPDVHINNSVGHIICHLTKGFDPGSFPNDQGKALNAGAHVPLGNGPEARPSASYSSRAPTSSALFTRAGSRARAAWGAGQHPPGAPEPGDARRQRNSTRPVLHRSGHELVRKPADQLELGDHPACRVPLTKKNSSRSNVDNFLFQVIDDREFWTIFTAQDPGVAPVYLAHFHWKVRYEFEFTWRDSKAVLRRSNSSVSVPERNVKGRPTEGALQGC